MSRLHDLIAQAAEEAIYMPVTRSNGAGYAYVADMAVDLEKEAA